MRLSLPSPAKINLFLHITGRQKNGYHNLQTLFQLLDYGDRLDIESNQSGEIQLSSPMKDVPDKDNLIFLAAQAI
ncbi:MAG: 4-diphosphocytidyl-2-C-methyl-D-erythritol kinase, partial [Porticoccus sp.]